MLYLYPLLLQAAKGVPFQPWLRGSIDGIRPSEMRPLMNFRDRFRKGVFTNVILHAKLEERYADRPQQVKDEVKRVFKKELFVANVRKMRKLVARQAWDPPEGVWTAYGERNSYTDDDAGRKDEFVREVATSRDWKLVWDIGCNNGRYSRIAAEGARTVVAVDADQGPVELLYRDLREAGNERILPLTMNLADPSPGLGWRGLERRSMPDRGKPDLVLALALVHHVAISANVPVKEFIDWLASLGTALVIEFPTREDPMVKKLLAPKRDGLHPDYELGFFERTLDVRRSAAALRPAEGQPRVLRRARLFGLRHRQLLRAAGGAAAGAAVGDRAAARPDPARGAQGGAHRLPGRALRADRRTGAQEVDRRLGHRADRPERAGRRRPRRALGAGRAGALVPERALAGPACVPAAGPAQRPDL
jgi:SAM-dependent methyltransferase